MRRYGITVSPFAQSVLSHYGLGKSQQSNAGIHKLFGENTVKHDLGKREITMPSPVINEIVRNHTGADTSEFVEIFGDPNTDYSNLTLIEIEGDSTNAGNILNAIPIGTTDANGFFVTDLSSNLFQNGTSTYLLVSDFTGSVGDDLDTDNDGVLDSTPYTAVIDGFALTDGGSTDQVYSNVVLGSDFDDGTFTVGGVSRAVDGVDTDSVTDFVRNDFDGQGLPGLGVDTATVGEAINTPGAANQIVTNDPVFTINEVDSDTDGSDVAEFIEIYDGGLGNSSLDGLVVVLYNGSDNQSYAVFDLTGFSTDENGFFVLGNAAVANVDLVINNGSIQNGADAVALFIGTPADFPNDTAITTTGLLDVVVYGTNDADDAELLSGFGQTVQVDESANGNSPADSIARLPDGSGAFVAQAPTPGLSNSAVDPGSINITINEVDSDSTGSDTLEFVELYDGGAGNTSLDGLVLVFYNGSDDQSYFSIDLTGLTTDANGFFVIGNAAVANVGLVIPNGSLQNGPDAVAVFVGSAADFPNDTAITTDGLVDVVVYGTGDADDAELLAGFGETVQADESANGNSAEDAIARVPNGSGDFVTQAPTPGASNVAVVDPGDVTIRINEVDADTTGTDTAEFVELYDGGAGNTSLDGLVLVFYNGSDDQSYFSIDLTGFTTDENGFFVIGNAGVANVDLVIPNGSLQNGADAVAVFVGSAADFPNDTAITTNGLVDVVVYDTNDGDDAGLLGGFGETIQVNEGGNGASADNSIARLPDGSGEFVAQAPTPGISNIPVPEFEINELRISSSGASDDTSNFVELFGAPGASLDGLTLLVISSEGDSGTIDFAFDLTGGFTDVDGVFLLGNAGSGTSFDPGDIQAAFDFSGSPLTFILVQDFTGNVGDDLDTDDDGVLDVTPYGNVIDSVSIIDGDATVDTPYSDVVVGPDGNFTPAHISRDTDGEGDFTIGQFGDLGDDTPGTLNAGGGFGNPTEVSIFDIQGESHISPLLGEIVVATGIVTAVDDNGFYFQDAVGDGNPATSDGVFVFTGTLPTVSVGDEVSVTGEVQEFGFNGRLTVTQIDAADVTINSSGNALPAAIIIGAGGLTPPSEIIISDDETTTPIDLSNPVDAAANNFDPEQDGIDFFEALEGSLVTIQDAVAVAPGNRFGEIYTVANGGADATGFNERGSITATEGDLNPERIQIQINSDIGPDFDAQSIQTGDSLGDVTGVVGYSFGNYEVIATQIGTPVAGGLEAEVTTLEGSENQLTIASYNVLNLDPSDTEQILAIAQQIVDNLLSPDIIALQEVQDDNGAASGTVSSDATLQALIDAIVSLGGPTYSFAVVDPVAENTQGGQPNGNIRVAYLYNDERVDLVSVTALNEATLAAAGVTDPTAFNGSRIPLEAVFSFNGEEVTIINNHFTSKGGSDDLFGALQPAEENGDDRRAGQAAALNDYVDSLLAANANLNIVVVGDFNDFDFSVPVDIIAGGSGEDQILFNQIDTVAATDDRYTFIFQGNAQAIDQFLVTGNLTGGTDFDIVHVNADFQNSASDHDPLLGRITLGEATPDDPIIATGTSGDDELLGGSGDDILSGGRGNDTLQGFAGNDSLSGGRGADLLSGGAGDDTLRGGRDNDVLDGGEGNDSLRGGRGDDALDGGAGDDTLHGGRGEDVLSGGDGDDKLHGGRGEDVLSGGDGDDELHGGRGEDVINGGAGNDAIHEGRGDDVLGGGDGDDLIFGARGTDVISGGAGNDSLRGGRGKDTLDGGEGDDELRGGRGDDTFVFEGASGNDIVTDFRSRDDTLDLAGTATDFIDAASVIAAATDTNVNGENGVLIDLGGGNSVFLEDISVSDLSGLNYVF